MLFFGKERRRDKVILLKLYGSVHKIVKRFYLKVSQTSFRYGKRTFQIPKRAEYMNRFGRFVYFVDYDSGKGIYFDRKGKQPSTLNPQLLDLFLHRGLVENFIASFGSTIKQDWIFILMTLGAGIAVGFVIHALIGG